jgi:hypothetical protein
MTIPRCFWVIIFLIGIHKCDCWRPASPPLLHSRAWLLSSRTVDSLQARVDSLYAVVSGLNWDLAFGLRYPSVHSATVRSHLLQRSTEWMGRQSCEWNPFRVYTGPRITIPMKLTGPYSGWFLISNRIIQRVVYSIFSLYYINLLGMSLFPCLQCLMSSPW